MITVRWLNGDPEEDIISAAAATAGKASLARCDIERMIRAEHSPIHEAVLRIEDDACRSDVVSHLVRHTKGHPRHYVQSFRPDMGARCPCGAGCARWTLTAVTTCTRISATGRAANRRRSGRNWRTTGP